MAQLPGYVSVLKPLLKSGLDILTQRLLHVGHWHGEYFLLCLAIGLCQIKTWPSKMSEYAKEVVDMLEESCTFITTPKTPSTMSPAASHVSLAFRRQCRGLVAYFYRRGSSPLPPLPSLPRTSAPHSNRRLTSPQRRIYL